MLRYKKRIREVKGMKDATQRKQTVATRKNYAALGTALRELMEEKDFGSISVQEICARALVPRATFYNYFADKYDLLKFRFRQLADSIAEELKSYDTGSREYFDKFVGIVIGYVDANRNLISGLLKAGSGMGLAIIEKALGEKLYENLMLSGRTYKVPTELLSEFYAGSIIFMVKWWLENETSYKKEELAVFIDLLVNPYRFI